MLIMTAQELSALMREMFANMTPEERKRGEELKAAMEKAGLFRLMGDSEE